MDTKFVTYLDAIPECNVVYTPYIRACKSSER